MKVMNFVFFTVCVVIAAADTKFGLSKQNSSFIQSREIVCKNAAERQFPYQVSLRSSDVLGPGKHIASGAIITNRHILTWATFGENTSPVYNHAIVGSTRIDKGGIRMELDAIYMHHRVWSERCRCFDYKHNIAVVMTTKEIIFNDYVQPIALPMRPLPAQGNVSVVLSGWGMNSKTGKLSNELRYMEMRTIPDKPCSNFDGNFVCTLKKDPEEGCLADGGSPLVDVTDPKNKVLVGIGNFRPGSMDIDMTHFTSVYAYRIFIDDKTFIP